MRRVVAALVVLHVLFVVGRVPRAVFGKRLEDLAEYENAGAVRFHLDNEHRNGAAAVEWILDETPENGVVLIRGEILGSLEFVAPLIWPRLLVFEGAVEPHASTFAGRPIAARVLVGLGQDLALEER